jgi:hypothetical protein
MTMDDDETKAPRPPGSLAVEWGPRGWFNCSAAVRVGVGKRDCICT